MLFSAFQEKGWDGRPPILILGGDAYLSAGAIEQARNRLLEKEPGLVLERVEYPEQDFSRALELFTLYGLWGGKREVEFSGDDLSAAQRQALLKLAPEYAGDNFLLVRLSSWKSWMEELPDCVLAVNCAAPKWRREFRQWLLAEAGKRRLKLTAGGAEEMLERLGETLGVLENGLTLMELSGDKTPVWDEGAVGAFFSKETEADIFQYAEAMAGRNLKRSLDGIKEFLDWGKPVPELIGGLRYYIRALIMMKMHADWSADDAWQRLKIRRDKYQVMSMHAGRYQLSQLKKMFTELYKLDRDSKMSGRDKDLLEMFTLRLFLELK